MESIITADDIAVLGLGPMGMPMARNLITAFGRITVWNRTAAVADRLADTATVAPDVAAAARPIVLTVLPDLPQVESLLDELRSGWASAGIDDPILVVHGTVSPPRVAELAAHLASDGIRVVDAPVSGGPIGAAAGTLSVMVGGDADAVRRLGPVFAALGATVRHLGPSGSGALAKLCNQVVVAATVAAVAEATVLAEAGGLPLEPLFELLSGGLAGSEVLRQKGERYRTRDFAGGGSALNQLKELRFTMETADARQLSLPVAAATTTLFERMVADGAGSLDHTGVLGTVEQMCGERMSDEP
ncbi:NAD(P)-dependent oxidoreductase [Cryobacterium tepidiphilum]|uniref:NAD(P)-dependent oxidoreductase n=1 Tax=Cryobacterium tepidiphilum TaxID=2486026 RepID=UPI001F33C559|nr:NAD(P)-dependent oxidoreductase [Cryobacterium tepidiphilum]